ncbi:MAG: glucose 1-dehydrogenase [Janthinobacterium lividum]
MQGKLTGQTALVTGASSGIGTGVALALARAGAAVAINYHSNSKSADDVVAEITAGGGRAVALQADVGQPDEVTGLFQATRDALGDIDIVIANSGIQKDAAAVDMTIEQWRAVVDTNLTGQFLTAQAAIREFLRRGPRPDVSRALGKIICMSSVHEVIPWAGHVNYAATKGGIAMLMRSLAQEVAHHKIRINAIAPGAIRTPINKDAWSTPEALEKLMKLVPYKRIGEVEDIGNAAVWLASDDSDYVVGTTLFVDGGMTLYPGFEDNG